MLSSPPPLLPFLSLSQGPELFLDNFLSDETDTPEVVWNDDMKDRLRNFLESDLESYVQARAADPHAVYMYSPKDPLVYPELAGGWEPCRVSLRRVPCREHGLSVHRR